MHQSRVCRPSTDFSLKTLNVHLPKLKPYQSSACNKQVETVILNLFMLAES